MVKASELKANPSPIDPDVVVPQAVRRAAEAATAAQAKLIGAPEAPPVLVSAGDTIVIAPPVPVSAVVTPPGNEPPAPTPAPVLEESWEHKFKSAEGRRIKAENLNSQLAERLTAMENMVADMRANPPAPTTPVPTPAPTKLVTEAEQNEFGQEMLDVMGRRAQEIVSPEIAELRATVTALEQKLTGTASTVQRNARQEMLTALDTRMPEWRQINDLAEFKTWLALPDPYFGAIRHNALLSAYEQNDTPRVLNFFKGFVSELAAPTPAALTEVIPPAPQPERPLLESLAAPGRARTPAATTPPVEKQIITTADVNAFYDAKRRGAYNGRETEFAQLEQELFLAQREGRVRAT
jgi:hypothetical protein